MLTLAHLIVSKNFAPAFAQLSSIERVFLFINKKEETHAFHNLRKNFRHKHSHVLAELQADELV